MATTRKLRTRPSGHEAGLCDVTFTPDGQHVLTSGGDGQVMIWAASKLAALGDDEPEHEGVITDDDDGITTMAVTPDGKYVITGSYGGRRVKRWTLETKQLDKCLTTCDGHVHHVATNAVGSLVAITSSDTVVRLLDVASGEYKQLDAHTRYAKSVAFDPRGESLVSTGADGTMRVWRIDDGSHNQRKVPIGAEDYDDLDQSHQFTRAAWSPDGKFLAAPATSEVRVYRRGAYLTPAVKLNGGGKVGAAHDAEVSIVAWSPDGKLLASAGLDKKICVWNMQAKPPAVVRSFTHDVHIHGLAWRPTASTTDAPSSATAAMLAVIDADGEMEVLTDVLPPAPAATTAASPAKGAVAATQAKAKAPGTAAAGSDADSDADMGEPSAAAAGAGAGGAPTGAGVVTSSKKNHRRAVVADSDDDSDDSESEAAVKAKKVLLKEGEASRARKDTGNISALKRTLAALDEDPTVEFGAVPTSVLDHADTASLPGAGTGALGMVKVQGAFMPNATVMGEDDDDAMVQLQYLAFNRRGAVLAIDTAGVRGIEVVFADTTTHRSMRFADNYNFVMGALGSEGVALASQSYEEDDDGAEGSRTVPSTIMYRPYVSWSGKSAQWVFKLPQGEDADVIACGQKFVAVATSSQRVRMIRASGVEVGSMSLPGPIITMSAQGPLLGLVYAVMASERGAINGYMVLDAEEGKVISSGTFTLNPLTTITWAGFSTYNMFVLSDSAGVLHGVTKGMGLGWQLSPILEFGGEDKPRLWPVDVQQHRLLAVKLPNGRSVPVASKPLPVLQAVPVRLPMILRGTDEAKLAEMCLRGKLVLAQRMWSVTNAVPLVGDLAPMDLDEDADEDEAAAHEQMLLRKEEAKIDKCLLQLINTACRNDRLARALDLSSRLNLMKSFTIAVKIAQRTQHSTLAQRIHDLLEDRREAAQAALQADAPSPVPQPTRRPTNRALNLSDDDDDHRTPVNQGTMKRGRHAMETPLDTPSSEHRPHNTPMTQRSQKKQRVVRVGGERRSKVREEEQPVGSDDDEGGDNDVSTSRGRTGSTPPSPPQARRSSLVRAARKTFDAPPPRNPFAKRVSASPQKKNRHVLDSLAKRSPQKMPPLSLNRSSSFSIRARERRQNELRGR